MSLIQSIKEFTTKAPTSKRAILLCGFGGAVWQTKRLIRTLNGAGYTITAIDFSKTVLSKGDPGLLPQLTNEVVMLAENIKRREDQEILLVGISLGALLSLNILRRSTLFHKAVMITGGNIVTVAKNIFGEKIWPQSYEELAGTWKDVNIWIEPELLKGKRMLFVLPTRDGLIDTSEVVDEAKRQNSAGNTVILIERNNFGHIGTIIEETIVFPHRILKYINQL